MTALARAGVTAAATGSGTLTVSELTPGQVIALLTESSVPISEVSAHRVTLEEAYLELTRDAVEFRAALAGSRYSDCRIVTAVTVRPERPGSQVAGFGRLLYAEWTKFRTVRAGAWRW